MAGEPSTPDFDVAADRLDLLGFDAIWEWDVSNGELVWARGSDDALGYDADEALQGADPWTELIHPDDCDRVRRAMDAAPEDGGSWGTDFRVRRADGEYATWYGRGLVVADDGGPGRVLLGLVEGGERRATRWQLEEVEERYRMITEQDMVGFYVIRDGEFVYVNPKLCELHGLTREELYSLGPAIQLIPEENRAALRQELRRLFAGEIDEAHYQGRIVRRGDDQAYVHARLTQVEYRGEPALLGTMIDLTEQVAAERAREESERLFEAVFENALDGIVITDDEGRIVDVNPATVELVGLDREAMVGRTLGSIEGLGTEPEAERRAFHHADAGRGTFRFERPDGEERAAEYASTPRILPDRNLTVLRDVTERRRQEDALETERERLDFMNAMLRHHVLNGLNIILATADHLTADADGTRADHLETIERRADAIVELVQTMRSLVRTIRGHDAPGFEAVDLPALLQDAAEDVAERFENADVTLEVPQDDLAVYADDMLAELFENLLDNAIRHQDADEPTVEVWVEADEETVSIRVADEGPGIPDPVREDVFDGGSPSNGSGFGLTLVHLLVTLYDGTLRLEDDEAGGAVVTVTLPRASIAPAGERSPE